MNAGDLNKRISITKTTITTDMEGNRINTESAVCTCWASANDAGMKEYYEAARSQMDHVVNFGIRHRTGIAEGMFVVMDGVKHEIKEINQGSHHKDYMTLKTTRWVVGA